MNDVAEILRKPEDELTLEDAVHIGSLDRMFYCKAFFPEAANQEFAPFHPIMWDKMLDPLKRLLAFMIFRGGAKTTNLRMFTSYLVAYGIARTVLYVGKSQDHAIKSVEWLKGHVEFNRKWTAAYGLKKSKSHWSNSDIEIHHGEGHSTRILAYGITGSIRGVNINDHRPDFIVVDDPCDEENTATPEQRKKMEDLFFGAVLKSLAPRSEAPLAKVVLTQTVLNDDDLISKAFRDPRWDKLRVSCFDDSGNSAWPARWTTEELREDKEAHIVSNQLSLWMREMEQKVISDEEAYFPWPIREWDLLPEGGRTWMAVDPTPPPKQPQAGGPDQKSLRTDDFVIQVLRLHTNGLYICEQWKKKSPDTQEWLNAFFEMATRWKVKMARVESVLFARMMMYILQKEMEQRRIWIAIHPIEDRRPKQVRIRDEVAAYAQHGRLFIPKGLTDYQAQYAAYPMVNNDDMLDCTAIGLCDEMGNDLTDAIEGEFTTLDESEWPDQPAFGAAI